MMRGLEQIKRECLSDACWPVFVLAQDLDTVVANTGTDDMRSAASWVFHPISRETKAANKNRSVLAQTSKGPQLNGENATQDEEMQRRAEGDAQVTDEEGDEYLTTYFGDEASPEKKKKLMKAASMVNHGADDLHEDVILHRTRSTPVKKSTKDQIQIQETSFFARQPSPILPRSGLNTPQDSPGKRVPRMSASSAVVPSPYSALQSQFNTSMSPLISSPGVSAVPSAVPSASQSPQETPARGPSPYAAEETLRQYEQLREERQRILRQRGEAFEAIWKQARWTGKEAEQEPAFSSLRRKMEEKMMKEDDPSSFSSSLRKRLEDRLRHENRAMPGTAREQKQAGGVRQEPTLQDIDDTNPLAFFQRAQANIKPPTKSQYLRSDERGVPDRNRLEEERVRLEQERALLEEEQIWQEEFRRASEPDKLGGLPDLGNRQDAVRSRRLHSDMPAYDRRPAQLSAASAEGDTRRFTTSGASPFARFDFDATDKLPPPSQPAEHLAYDQVHRRSGRSRRPTSSAAAAQSRHADLRMLEEQLQRDAQLRIEKQMRQYKQQATQMQGDGADMDEVIYFDQSPTGSEHELDMVFEHHRFDADPYHPAQAGQHHYPAQVPHNGLPGRAGDLPVGNVLAEQHYHPEEQGHVQDRQYYPPDADELEAVHFGEDSTADLMDDEPAPPPFFTPQGATLDLQYRPPLLQHDGEDDEDGDEMVLFM